MLDKVVIVSLTGGLGNQLFQYALGRRLARDNGFGLELDTSGYEGHEPDSTQGVRICSLQHFNIKAELVGRKEVGSVCWRGWLDSMIQRFKPYYARRSIEEPRNKSFVYDARLVRRRLRHSICLRYGFWQSEKYFLPIEQEIREELTFRNPPSGLNAVMASEIADDPVSVAVHVRHGDNASLSTCKLGVLPLSYYDKAIEDIHRQVENAHFYVFSDDPNWARSSLNMANAYVTFVNHNDARHDYEDLRLMSLCKHHIIANSTFGWWGAWLARHDRQIVYAPRRYYPELDIANPDLYPKEWRLI